MLALARSEGQSIIIDGNIEVKIVKWSRSSVRLAIQAPREVKVDRDEIWRRENPGKPTPLEIAEAERREPLRPRREFRRRAGAAASPAVPAANEEAKFVAIESDRCRQNSSVRPTPDAPPFVHVGTTVEARDRSRETGSCRRAHEPAHDAGDVLAESAGRRGEDFGFQWANG